MKALVRTLYGLSDPTLLRGEIALSSQPRAGSIFRETDKGPFHTPSLIDQVMRLINERGQPFGKVAVWDLDVETTLAAAVAVGAQVSTEICGDIAEYTASFCTSPEGFARNPSCKIIKAYYIAMFREALRPRAVAASLVRFWSEDLTDLVKIKSLADEFDTIHGFGCDMDYREILEGVTLVLSEGSPVKDIETDTFIWVNQRGSDWHHMLAYTMLDDPSFMRGALDIVRDLELMRLKRAGINPEECDWWTLSPDERTLSAPKDHRSMVEFVEVLEILARLAG